MGFPFLKSKFSLYKSKATMGLIKNFIGNGICQQHTTRYLKLCLSSSSSFNRFNSVDKFPRGVRFFHEKGNGFVPESSMEKFVKKMFITFCFVHMSVERVPYSNKTHLIFYSSMLETYWAEKEWKKLKEGWKKSSLIVDQVNPKAIRVQKILNVLLRTMHNGLGLEHGYTINGTDLVGEGKKLEGVGRKVKNRKGSRFGFKYGTKHLEGLDWEVILFDDDFSNAYYLATGKIAVSTGAIEGLSDSQIAATIAHEIGHGVARHPGESLFRAYWYFRVLKLVGVPTFVLAMIKQFFYRRRELEADYIGLVLMASAGYDPQAALDAFCKDDHESSLDSTHPSAEKRAKMLKKNMGKAVAIYEQVLAGQEFYLVAILRSCLVF